MTQTVRGEHREFDAQEVSGRFKDVKQDESRVIFIWPAAERGLIQLVKAKKFVINNEVIDQEQRICQFREHTYISEDPEEIALIRKHRAYKSGVIKELKQVAEAAKEKRVNDVLAQLDDPNVKAAVAERLGVGRANVPTVKAEEPRKK